jgi:hypothetical protein
MERVLQGAVQTMEERVAAAAARQEREQRAVSDTIMTMGRGLQELTNAVWHTTPMNHFS